MIRRLINNFLFTVSTYTKIPVPQVEFNRKNTSLTFLCLPIVGMLLGLIYYGLFLVLSMYIEEIAIISIIMIIINIQVTGGIHFDGFLDSVDAFKSYRDNNVKKRIIKDARVGAFAVIHFVSEVLLYFVTYYFVIKYEYGILFMIMPIVSRTMILPIVCKNKREEKDMLDDLIGQGIINNYRQVMFMFMLFIAGILVVHNHVSIFIVFGFVFGAAILYGMYFNRMYKRHFEELNGDLCGYYIVNLEILAPLAIVIYAIVSKILL